VKDLCDFRLKVLHQFTRKFRPSSLRVNGARIENVNDGALGCPILPPMRKLFRVSYAHAMFREQHLQKRVKVERDVSLCARTRRIVDSQLAVTGLFAISQDASPFFDGVATALSHRAISEGIETSRRRPSSFDSILLAASSAKSLVRPRPEY